LLTAPAEGGCRSLLADLQPWRARPRALVSVLLLLAASAVYVEQRSRAGRLGQVAYAVAVSLVVSVFTGLGVVASYFLAGTDSQVFDLFHSAEAIPYVAFLLGILLFGIATIRSRTHDLRGTLW